MNCNPVVRMVVRPHGRLILLLLFSCGEGLATLQADFTGTKDAGDVASQSADGGKANGDAGVVDAGILDGGINDGGTSSGSQDAGSNQTPPAPPILSAVSPAGPVNNNNPVVSGQTQPNMLVTLFANVACTGNAYSQAFSDGTGSFQSSILVQDNSTVTFYANATRNGLRSACASSAFQYIEDSAAPASPNLTAISPLSGSNNLNPQLSGTAEAGATVRLYGNSACSTSVLGQAVTNAAGLFSVTATVAEGSSNDFHAKATDTAGNTSGCSTSHILYQELAGHCGGSGFQSIESISKPGGIYEHSVNAYTGCQLSGLLFCPCNCQTYSSPVCLCQQNVVPYGHESSCNSDMLFSD